MFLLAGLAVFTLVAGPCGDSPTSPPPPAPQVDFRARFTAATSTLVIDPPGTGEPLRLQVVAVSIAAAEGRIEALVRLHNPSAGAVVGPAGVELFGFEPTGPGPTGAALCDPTDAAAPALAPDGCRVSHRDTYGGDGMLSSGETADPVAWTIDGWSGGDFTFRVRFAGGGFTASGEISGTVFEDRDGDGARDRDEPGQTGTGVALQYPESLAAQAVDDAGRFSFHVSEPGVYLVRGPASCCLARSSHVIEIVLLPDGRLSSYGAADFACGLAPPGLPRPLFVDVRAPGSGLTPCAGAEPCTIPAGSDFQVRFEGAAGCRPVSGVVWQRQLPGAQTAEPWQPYGRDDLFLPIGTDVASTDPGGDTLWALSSGRVTLYERPVGWAQPTGRYTLRVRVQDEAGLVSLLVDGTRVVQLGFDPQTWIQRAAECDCPAPPPGCAPGDSIPLGWIVGLGRVDFPPPQWIPFCSGDTIPQGSRVRFYVRGRDDRRDEGGVPSRAELGYRYRFEARAEDYENAFMPWSNLQAAQDFPLPGGGAWRGGASDWPGVCPFDYRFYAAAADAGGRLDGTPDSIPFHVGGAPAIDSLAVPAVVVLVPTCPTEQSARCSSPTRSFGPDTLVVFGVHLQDEQNPPATPLRLGWNRFGLPLIAWGHDHPRDRNAPGREYYAADHEGRIRAWWFGLDCEPPGCLDLEVPGEGFWRRDQDRGMDPPGQEVFDDTLQIVLPLDTLCTDVPCSPDGARAVVGGSFRGPKRFTVQARDWDFADRCWEPSDLSSPPDSIQRLAVGRTSAPAVRTLRILQLEDLSPPTARPGRLAALRRRLFR